MLRKLDAALIDKLDRLTTKLQRRGVIAASSSAPAISPRTVKSPLFPIQSLCGVNSPRLSIIDMLTLFGL